MAIFPSRPVRRSTCGRNGDFTETIDDDRMKRCLLLLVCIAVLCEFTAFSVLRVGKRFSFGEFKARQLGPTKRAQQLLNDPPNSSALHAIHPYLGYVYNPEANREALTEYHRLPISDSGFLDDKSPIQTASPDRIIVGVFGGSVAYWWSVSGGLETLWDELKQAPEYAHRQLMVVRVTLGGYKHPQQLMALNYLLALGAHFDVVLNLDGFNEVALPPSEHLLKGIFPFYPMGWSVLTGGALDSGLAEMIVHKHRLERRRQRWAQWVTQTPLRYSATMNLFWGWYDQRLRRAISKDDLVILQYPVSGTRYGTRGPPRSYATPAALYEDLAAMWKNSSLLMHQLCEANGIRYVHFLQPNQYVPGSKRMGAEERRAAIQLDHPYREPAEQGYPYLRSAGQELLARGGQLS